MSNYLDDQIGELVRKMSDSAISLTLFSGKIDAKILMEMGAAILLDKPVYVVALGDGPLPENLARVAKHIETAHHPEDLGICTTRLLEVAARYGDVPRRPDATD